MSYFVTEKPTTLSDDMMVTIDGDGPISFGEFLDHNEFGAEEIEWMRDWLCRSGETFCGGGAAPLVTIKLVEG